MKKEKNLLYLNNENLLIYMNIKIEDLILNINDF